MHLGKEEKVSRRGYVKYAAAGVVVVAVAAGGAYYATRPKPTPTPTPTPTPKPTPTPTPTPTVKPTPTPTPTPTPVTINAYFPAHSNFMASEAVLGEFTKKTGIKVNAIVDSFFVIHDKLASTFAAGVYAYDACYTWGAWLAEFLEFYQPLDEIGVEPPKEVVDDLIPWTRFSCVFKEKWYGLPNAFWVMVLHMNKDLYSEAGLETPTTWSQFLENCEALKKKYKAQGIYPFAAGLKQGYLFPHFCAFLHGNAGRLWKKDERRTVQTDSPECVEAVKDLVYLYDNYMDPGSVEWIAGIESGKAYYTKKAAMTLYYPWHTVVGRKYMGITSEIALWPGKKTRSGSGSASEAQAIPRTAKFKKEAFELMKFNTSDWVNVQKVLAIDDKYESCWPILNHQYDAPELQNFVYPGFIKTIREQAKYNCTRYERPAYEKIIVGILEAEIVNAINKSKKPEDAMKDAFEAIDPVVEDEYARYGGGYEDPWETMPHPVE